MSESRQVAAASREVDEATVGYQRALSASVRVLAAKLGGREPEKKAADAALAAARDRLVEATHNLAAARRVAAVGRADADGDLVVVEHQRPQWGARRGPTLLYPPPPPPRRAAASPAAASPASGAVLARQPVPRLCPACGQAPAGPRGGRCATCVKARIPAGRGAGEAKRPCRDCGQNLTPRGGRCPACATVVKRSRNCITMRRLRAQPKGGRP